MSRIIRRRAILLFAASLLVPTSGRAHFVLIAPDSWMSQDAFGSPQKLGPCGNEGGGVPTGKVTAFQPGETISVTIDEGIFHPGHYRVALAVNDRNELPAEPAVTPNGGDPCGSAAIQDPPVLPILADNLLPHTQPFQTAQTFTVTLPSDVSCDRCTLQVLEFMSHHPAPCFYHHCADISIQAALPTPASPTATGTPVATATAKPTATQPPATPAAACVGDCDGSGAVNVDEIIAMVNIALGAAPIAACTAGDVGGDHEISIDEILLAINNGLAGCP